MDFLVRRPIAVIMAFLAVTIIGAVMYRLLPVSLLPDIPIPQITVVASDAKMSARDMENNIIGPVRRHLLQVGGVEDITSTTSDGIGKITLLFRFGTNTDYAYIEVNEKIDACMGALPPGTARPKAIKASATDIPAFYINISLKSHADDSGQFMQMCEAAENIIRRRIEQLPEVAMADMTGAPSQCIAITPDYRALQALGLTVADIDLALANNNITAGSLRVKDGIYEYAVKVSSLLRSADDIGNIYLRCGNRTMQLKDICRAEVSTISEKGASFADGKRTVTLAVIKQSDHGMEAMRERIAQLTEQFRTQFPDLDFRICRNQTDLLDYTIGNLKQNLAIGIVLIIVVAMLFMGGVRPSVIIALSIAASVIITFVPFYAFGKSVNIISLSGLILVVGMMIDNGLIVCENIAQWQQRGSTLRAACVGGTREMITPLLTSTLTTVAVFVPLVFIDGMAGALFADQAFAITAGLAVSYAVGIMLLPVIYRQIMAPTIQKKPVKRNSTEVQWISRAYGTAHNWTMSHPATVITLSALAIPLCVVMFAVMQKSRMPHIDYHETTARIEWNEEISAEENIRRTEALRLFASTGQSYCTAYVGAQDYAIDAANELSPTESELYWECANADSAALTIQRASAWLAANYPAASATFAPPATIFEKLFNTSEADITVRLSARGASLSPDEIRQAEADIRSAAGQMPAATTAFRHAQTIVIDRKAAMRYNISLPDLNRAITNAIGGAQIDALHSHSTYMPICIAPANADIASIINATNATARGADGTAITIPLRQIVRTATNEELKTITAGKDGEYIPISLYNIADGNATCTSIAHAVANNPRTEASYTGAFFSNQNMMRQLLFILCISVLLMYFILCAQFESFRQPLIVLAEIPIDTAFALVALWLCGETLNLMSGIGIIVSCGIIINDSILKIDTINELRRGGMALAEAVHTAGLRRLKAIIMTSVTTIGAALPILLTSDIGSAIQRPLAIALIATLTIGTAVSLFAVPLAYTLIERKR